jgi:hypothetical protein
MPCIFCVAAFMLVTGPVGTVVIEELEKKLRSRKKTSVKKTVDTKSVAKFEIETEAAGKTVPVAVTVFKEQAGRGCKC